MNEVKPWDWKRILIGEAPPEFLIEVFIRTLIVFFLLLIVVRVLGKRMNGQISIAELALMVMLGAIISPGMQLPDRGILFVATAFAVIISLYMLVNYLSTKSEKFEHFAEGKLDILVKDGIMQVEAMKRTGISKQELFAQLRQKQVENLSEVDRVYLEACGIFTVFKAAQTRPGLVVFPEKDQEMLNTREHVNHGLRACCNCGHVQDVISNTDKCEVCEHNEWIGAYV